MKSSHDANRQRKLGGTSASDLAHALLGVSEETTVEMFSRDRTLSRATGILPALVPTLDNDRVGAASALLQGDKWNSVEDSDSGAVVVVVCEIVEFLVVRGTLEKRLVCGLSNISVGDSVGNSRGILAGHIHANFMMSILERSGKHISFAIFNLVILTVDLVERGFLCDEAFGISTIVRHEQNIHDENGSLGSQNGASGPSTHNRSEL